MPRILILLCTLIMISGGAVSQSQGGIGTGPAESWIRYTVKDEEFSVRFPVYPEMLTSKVRRKGDGKERLERQLRGASGNIYFGVKTFENPEPRRSLEQFIVEESLITGYDLATERRLTIGGFAGIEYASPNKNYPTIVQFVATERHVYSFIVNGADAPGRAKEFFSSIKLGKKTDGLEVVEASEPPSLSEVGERIYMGKEVDVKVRLLSKPAPIYPEESGPLGLVILKAIFARTGRVVNVRVIKSLPGGLTEAAINAARKITFTPAMKDGQPVSMWMQLEYHFN